MNATQLRANLFVVLRRVLSTGKPEDVEWKGRHLRIIPHDSQPVSGKFARLRSHPEVLPGDPEAIVHMDWSSEWQGDRDSGLS